MFPDFTCEILPDGLVQSNDILRIMNILNEGGICLLPSDSAYILTGLPTIPKVIQDINSILDRHRIPMSLAFGSLDQADSMIRFSPLALDFIRRLLPGGLTFVARPKTDAKRALAIKRLNAPGTIGVRLTESQVETQLAGAIDYPLPTTPVRRSNHTEVDSAEEALSIVAARVSKLPVPRKVAVIVGSVPYPGRLSSVVKEELHNGIWRIVITRVGAIPVDTIKRISIECQYDGAIVCSET